VHLVPAVDRDQHGGERPELARQGAACRRCCRRVGRERLARSTADPRTASASSIFGT
jgi:hypothetical protein